MLKYVYILFLCISIVAGQTLCLWYSCNCFVSDYCACGQHKTEKMEKQNGTMDIAPCCLEKSQKKQSSSSGCCNHESKKSDTPCFRSQSQPVMMLNITPDAFFHSAILASFVNIITYKILLSLAAYPHFIPILNPLPPQIPIRLNTCLFLF